MISMWTWRLERGEAASRGLDDRRVDFRQLEISWIEGGYAHPSYENFSDKRRVPRRRRSTVGYSRVDAGDIGN